MNFGQRLKRMRRQRGYSLRQLETLSGVDRGLISRLEREARPRVGLDVAKRLALALGVTLDYLASMYEEDGSELEPAALAAVGD